MSRQPQNPIKKDFGTGPTSYVAGYGRGAIGFITRSDIGPAKLNEPPVLNQNQNKPRGGGGYHDDDDGDNENYNDAKYDEWNGYQIPLFNHGDYDDEDREADQVYQMVDEHLDGRRRSRKDKLLRDEIKRIRSENPNIAQQFSDLKRDLAQITMQDWMNIPETGDYTIKKKRQEKYVPNTDSMLNSVRTDGQHGVMVNENPQSYQLQQNLNEVGEVRGTLLSLKLDRMGDSVQGQTNVDKRGYLTDLQSLPMSTGAEIGDFKKARLLLKSLIQADPKNSFGWLAAARVEELDGKLQAARNILAQGLQQVEDSEDVWIECARLETQDKAKQILAKAVTIHPTSVKIWLASTNKETDRVMKCKVLKRALEFIPNSEKLWKELIELSTENEARVLLHKAVECIPSNIELWLALAKLETYAKAKAVLNKARQYLPQETSIWIHAAKLEESAGRDKMIISTILSKAIKVLAKNGVKIVRDDWLAEAELAEKSENYQTCFAIVRACVGYNINDEERERIWLEDADVFEKRNSIFTARAIYQYAVEILPSKINILNKWLVFEEKHSCKRQPLNITENLTEEVIQLTPEQIKQHCYLDEALATAIVECPLQEEFWVKSILRQWGIGNQEQANSLLEKSELVLPNNEKLLTLSGKLQIKIGNTQEARKLLTKAQEFCSGVKSWTTLIKFEILSEDLSKAAELAELASSKFPQSEKIWSLYGRIIFKLGKPEEARKIFEKAVLLLPQQIRIWTDYVHLECSLGLYSRARPILDKARNKNPRNPELWVLSVKVEIESGNKKAAIISLNRALQECPRHGELWSFAIELEPKNTCKKKSADAVTMCVDDPYVYLSTAKIFWKENKMEKFTRWIEKSILLNPRLGDAWAYLYLQAENEQLGEDLIQKCLLNKPRDGRLWREVKKEGVGWRLTDKQILLQVAKRALFELQRID